MTDQRSVISRHKETEDKSPIEIFFLLKSKGYTTLDIDRKFNLVLRSTHKSLAYPHANAESAISKILQIPAYKIWPSRYDQNGMRLKPQPTSNYKTLSRIRHSQKEEGASHAP